MTIFLKPIGMICLGHSVSTGTHSGQGEIQTLGTILHLTAPAVPACSWNLVEGTLEFPRFPRSPLSWVFSDSGSPPLASISSLYIVPKKVRALANAFPVYLATALVPSPPQPLGPCPGEEVQPLSPGQSCRSRWCLSRQGQLFFQPALCARLSPGLPVMV